MPAWLPAKFDPKLFERVFWQKPEHGRALQIIKSGQYDLIHANDWDALPVACAAVNGTETRVLFDAHEYTPGQFTQHFTGRYIKSHYFEHMLRVCSPNIHGMITVSDGIAKLYKENFDWNASVVRNAPKYISVDNHSVAPTSVRLVHHGGALRKRSLDLLIHLVSLLDDRFNLTFILVPTDKAYLSQLKQLANRLTPAGSIFLTRFLQLPCPGSYPPMMLAYTC